MNDQINAQDAIGADIDESMEGKKAWNKPVLTTLDLSETHASVNTSTDGAAGFTIRQS